MSQRAPRPTQYYHDLVKTFPSMSGKSVLITGCTSGTGLVLARTCGKLGATVVMLNRPSERAEKALRILQEEDRSDALFVPCDLQSFASVREAGKTLRAMFGESGCDVLCNNAGIMAVPDAATIDGYDVQMQSNHLSHFLLTHEVWPLLEKAAALRGEARVVNHSSGSRRGKALSAEYLGRNGGKLGGDGFPGLQKWSRYQQSKLANLLFTYALHDRKEAVGASTIKILTAHPGPTDSGLQGKTMTAGGTILDQFLIYITMRNANSLEDGTCGIARCSCEPGVESAAFYGPAGRGKGGPAVLLPPERNPAGETLLWDESMKATGITDFFSKSQAVLAKSDVMQSI